MIIFELILFFVSIGVFSISVAGYGTILSSKIKIKSNFFLDIFLGFIIISTLITTLHFFFKIEINIKFLFLLIGLLIFFKKKKYINSDKINQKKGHFLHSNHWTFNTNVCITKIS